jgi:hypothetical protein
MGASPENVSFYPEDEDSIIIRNIDTYLPDYAAPHPKTNYLRKHSSGNFNKDKIVIPKLSTEG